MCVMDPLSTANRLRFSAVLTEADVPPQLVGLREVGQSGDAHSVERITHTLKGSAGNMDAVKMEAICAELEEMGRSETLTTAPGPTLD